jgi:carbamoyl-phosphate synthase large subunit
MEIVRDQAQLERYIAEAVVVSGDSPVLLDSYLSGAVEVDVDCLSDGKATHVAGIMQHIEEAGVHSGDSACSLPPHSLSDAMIAEIRKQTEALAKALNVVGQRRGGLPDRGQPACVPHRTICGQGHRFGDCIHRRPPDGR